MDIMFAALEAVGCVINVLYVIIRKNVKTSCLPN